MLYEKMTYESILQEMLNRVSDDVDKKRGSIIYDALAPAAYFLADQYFQLENFIDLLLPDTALGEYLIGQSVGMALRGKRRVRRLGKLPCREKFLSAADGRLKMWFIR